MRLEIEIADADNGLVYIGSALRWSSPAARSTGTKCRGAVGIDSMSQGGFATCALTRRQGVTGRTAARTQDSAWPTAGTGSLWLGQVAGSGPRALAGQRLCGALRRGGGYGRWSLESEPLLDPLVMPRDDGIARQRLRARSGAPGHRCAAAVGPAGRSAPLGRSRPQLSGRTRSGSSASELMIQSAVATTGGSSAHKYPQGPRRSRTVRRPAAWAGTMSLSRWSPT